MLLINNGWIAIKNNAVEIEKFNIAYNEDR